MFKNIKKTLLLNKKNFDHIEGKRIYYSPQITWLTASVLFLWLVIIIYLISSDSGFFAVGAICLAVFFYQFINMFHKVIFKNPIFIINNHDLFYTKNELWYDLTKCTVDEVFDHKWNYYNTLSIKCEPEENSFKESYWYIEYDDELKKAMKKYWNK